MTWKHQERQISGQRWSPAADTHLHDLSEVTVVLQTFQLQLSRAHHLIGLKQASVHTGQSISRTNTQRVSAARCLLPFVDDFKLDAFRLDDAFKAPVGAVDVEFKLLLELRAAAASHGAGFVPLGLLLHTNTDASKQRKRSIIITSASPKVLTALGNGNSNFTLAPRSLGETPEGRGRSEKLV